MPRRGRSCRSSNPAPRTSAGCIRLRRTHARDWLASRANPRRRNFGHISAISRMITEKRFPQLAFAASAASSAGRADRMISVIARSPRHDCCEFRCGLQYFALRIETRRRCNRWLAPPRNGGRPATRAACPWRHSVGVGAKNRVERRLAHRSPTRCQRVAGRYAGRVYRGS